jgi:hypothetical protein
MPELSVNIISAINDTLNKELLLVGYGYNP